MNEIEQEQNTTVKLYREFFIKAENEVKQQLAQLKNSDFCHNCKKCCKIRYSEFSPEEIRELGYEEFLKTFLPLGAEKENDIVDLKTNHYEAFHTDMEYAQKVINSNEDKAIWFYGCKYYQTGVCKKGKEKPLYCSAYPQTAFTILHDNCGFCEWQKLSLDKLKNDMSKDILERIQKISEYKNSFSCACCATCCKLACSEFSYEELKEKAENGDNFATQFTSVFVPYENEEDAYKYYQEYIDYLYSKLPEGEKVYFYYCPKNKDNLCTDYENRPQICREFPTNPLMILPKICGYKEWQEETHTTTLLLHALVEIVDFYIKRLSELVK